jgi:hypothetical protein
MSLCRWYFRCHTGPMALFIILSPLITVFEVSCRKDLKNISWRLSRLEADFF